ncbi:hypothetical protein [Edwardsiella phage IW-1]|uniref:Uncharacterized protein n=1 Tax=Edwardsiella phage IW-1 TaxID=1244857 RepID=K4Q372_9CAUD|nr:hypothetical protein [Edwardsiella phage IW-1]
MKLQQFNGGLHTRPRPQFIDLSQGVVYENINQEAGSLAPVMLPKDSGQAVLPYHTFYVAGNKWVSSNIQRYYVEFQKTLYWCDGIGLPQKLNMRGAQTNLGLAAPSTKASFRAVDNPGVVSDVEVKRTEAAGSGLPSELHVYVIVNVDGDAFSNALQLTVDTKGTVNTIAESTPKPIIQPKINSDTSTTKYQVSIGQVKGVTIGSGGVQVYRQYNNKFRLVGTITNGTATVADTVYDIGTNLELDFTKFGALQGVYQYVTTFVNSNDGAESAPSALSEELDLKGGGSIYAYGFPQSEDRQVDKMRLYRVGGNLGEFTLVKELPIATLDYTDATSDASLPGTLLTTQNAAPAPAGLKYMREAYAMLFAAEGSKLRFTPVGRPNEWPETFFLQYDADITGIAPVANGILVFTEYRTHIVTGNGPSVLSTYLLSGDQGCISNESIQFVGAEALWVSSDGICVSSGAQINVITRELLGKLDIRPVDSAVYDGQYYVMTDSGLIYCINNGTVKHFRFDISSLAVANDKLYGYNNGTLWELFASTDPAVMRFKSALMTEGSFTLNKVYKKIFTYSAGHIIIRILINGTIVVERVLSGEDSFDIQVPQELQRGFNLQFEVEGTGEVSELEYVVGA